MKCDFWFPSPIYTDFLRTIDNDIIRDFCIDLKSKSSGRKMSNMGGWQSDALDLNTPELMPLFFEINKSCNSFKTHLGMKDDLIIMLHNIWININQPGDYNAPHLHPGAAFAGTYYVKCNPVSSGCIRFQNPIANHEYHVNRHLFKDDNNLVANTACKYPPEEGKIIIFPAWLNHYVEPNKDTTSRISLSFNTVITSMQGK